MRISQDFQDNYPFISVITHVGQEYVGVIINRDSQIISFYDYSAIKTDEEKKRFLDLGETWWWESNRMIPINIFLNKDMIDFRYAIRNLSTKDVKILLGPCTSLDDIIVKRIKRKSITLVRKTS